MLSEINLKALLVLDIETVPAFPDYHCLPEEEKQLWDRKSGQLVSDERRADTLYPRAGIYAEFGKIVCISVGRMSGNDFKISSFTGRDEKLLLEQFIHYLKKHIRTDSLLCAHNGKEFDFPYLARRILINRLPLPSILDLAGKKPWEVKHLDTLELWKFGDYKHYTSLDVLSHVFGLPSPKQEVNGSMIADLWWKEQNVRKIRDYCERDVLAVMNLVRCYRGEVPLPEVAVEYQR